jgi:UDP-glucuronate 4-epimerase
MQDILVTGGAGFIGSHFIEHLLAQGASQIVCLDNFNDYYDPAIKRRNVRGFAGDRRVEMVEGDFCDPEFLRALFARRGLRRVVHLGAYAGVRYSILHPLIYERANVYGTNCLLEAAREFPIERFLLISSSTVYGKDAPAPFVEDGPLGTPLSPYGATKRAAELLGLTYWQLYGVPVACIRPFSVYGPRLRPDLALAVFSEAILNNKPLPLFGDGSIRRDFTHVSDICAGLRAALTAPGIEGEAINLGHHEPIPIREVIRLLEETFGREARIDRQAAKPGEMPITNADLSKARRLLGYEPKVAFRDGLVEYVDWFRRQREIETMEKQ